MQLLDSNEHMGSQLQQLQKEADREHKYENAIRKQEAVMNRLQQLVEKSVLNAQKSQEYKRELDQLDKEIL